MFNWLISMFGFFKKKGKDGKKELVLLSEADAWLLDKTKKEMKKLLDSLDEQFDIISSDSKNLKKRAILIEEEEAKDIEDDDKKALEESQEKFAGSITALAKSLSFGEEATFLNAQAYLEKNKNMIKMFEKENAGAKERLRGYFSVDISKIDESLASISERLEKIKEILSDNLASQIDKTRKKISELNELVEKKNDYSEMISESEEKFRKLKEDKDARENRMAELSKSKEYIEFQQMESKIEEIEKKLNESRKAFKSDFTGIDSAMKRFGKLEQEHQGILDKYRKDAEEAIIIDEELKIISALKRLSARIDELEPDTKKKAKILQKIGSIDELYFQRFVDKKNNLEFDKNGLKRRMNLVTVKKEIDDIDYKIKHIDDKMKMMTKDITKLNKALEKTDIEDLKEKVEKELSSLTGEKVEIEIRFAEEDEEEKENKSV